MSSLKKYRVPVDGKFKLRKIDPGDTPFLEDSETRSRTRLEKLANDLDELQNKLHAEGRRKVLLVLQGMDTSGKDGTIRWVFSRTSPLGVRVTAFKAPNDIERAHDFLWRCHVVVPAGGQLMVWNRSHYEDVLVPVVEKFIDKDETVRRYQQINDFERLLVESGTTIVKCMLHISRDEQRKRLQERIDEPDKNWKFARTDLDVRRKWDAYQQAYEQALARTSTRHAPWHVIPADSKVHRNLMIARLLIETLEGMKLKFPPADPSLQGIVVE